MKPAKLAQWMLGKKYDLGNKDGGLDCLSFLLFFYRDYMPEEWHGWTRENYAERWDKGEGREEFYIFLHELGTQIKPAFMSDNDLLILDTPDGITPAIYLGSGNIMVVSTEQGAFVMPINFLKCDIKEVRRLG